MIHLTLSTNPISTPERWWEVLDAVWPDVQRIVFDQMDLEHAAYETPGNAESAPTGRTIKEELDHLRSARDSKLGSYLNAAWCLATDNYAWSVPNWGVFCTLCSERWVFNPDQTE